ncbi:MAG: GNAT family N-acetyltransferase [Rubrobacteraceae bacterium]
MIRSERVFSIEQIDKASWSALEPPDFPFFDFEFLRALERSGSIGRASGWSPVYLLCKEDGRLTGALCLYLKTDSYGEYIFDWEWAHAYQQHGLPYYPKLVSAVPFTPATGPKLLMRSDDGVESVSRAEVIRTLLEEARKLGEDLRVSSSHALFLPEKELEEFTRRGFAVRHSLQFHWHNRGYETFADYLGALEGKRRRQVARERRQLGEENLEIERLTGEDLSRKHASVMYRFYTSTLDRKWGMPYLTEEFFEEVFQTMGDRILLVLARDGESNANGSRLSASRLGLGRLGGSRPIAGALNFFKGGSLFGRYWGTVEDRRNLHFELCYYQEIEFAIERRLSLFEAGAQGEHKHARGFLPSLTYSAHDIRHPGFRDAIEEYIETEKEILAETLAAYDKHYPYKR